MREQIECVYESQDGLGEAPVWVEQERSLYWSDHVGCSMKCWNSDTGEVKIWDTPGPVGSFAFGERGGIVGGTDRGFCRIDLDKGLFEPIVNPESDRPGNRFNDGKCDRRGRFWCGSMNKKIERKTGSLYRFDPDLSAHTMALDFSFMVSNGIAFDPEDTRMYFADTLGQMVYVFDFDIESGEISNRREFFSTKDRPGMVDGATVDQDGYYWCALVAGSKVLRIDPKGRVDREIDMPVPRPTCPTFGGERYDVLYVTSQRLFMTPKELETYPQAGNLFAIHGVGARGFKEPLFAGL